MEITEETGSRLVGDVHIGWKVEAESLGYVADFCPFCRWIRRCSFARLTQMTSVYYVPILDSELGHQIECTKCHCTYATRESKYKTISKDAGDLNALIQHTQPDVFDNHLEELQLEARVRSARGSRAERFAAMRDSFSILKTVLEKQNCNAWFSTWHWPLVLLAALVGAVAAELINSGKQMRVFVFFAALTTTIGLLFVRWQMNAERRSAFMRTSMIPMAAQAIAPLRPSIEELRAFKDDLLERRYSFVEFIDVNSLHTEIQNVPPEPDVEFEFGASTQTK